MLFNPTENKLALRIYAILWEIFIGFCAFILFFGIFIKYYFHSLEENLLKSYIRKSLSFYKPIIKELNRFEILSKGISDLINIDDFTKDVEIHEKEILDYNSNYDNLLIKYIIYSFLIFLGVLILPILLGIISVSHINLKYIATSFILHIILVSIFEYILLWHIIPINNPIKIFNLFEGLTF